MKVTDTIKAILKQQARKTIDGQAAVQALLQEVRKEIVAELATETGSSFQTYRLKQSLASIERHLATFQTAADRELSTGLSANWGLGENMLKTTMQTAGMEIGNYWLSTDTLNALKDFTYGRIASVTADATARIRGELTLGMLGQKTPQEVAAGIAGTLESPGVFKTIAERAEVITGTEMGRAFSLATEKSIVAAQDTVPELRRMWLHAGHPRMPRQVHLLMHGQVREVGKPFYQTAAGEKVFYPRDPNAPIKEIIRCGCTHVPYMEAWGSAKEFAAQWDQTQYQLWFKKAA